MAISDWLTKWVDTLGDDVEKQCMEGSFAGHRTIPRAWCSCEPCITGRMYSTFIHGLVMANYLVYNEISLIQLLEGWPLELDLDGEASI